jgi:cellulose synthase/poly-beta-1,6-N-acetylglucosamine synthase-like glycosyltransferase
MNTSTVARNEPLRISVVIPTHNRLDTLQYVIPALLAQTIAAEQFEIVVADSLSNDGTADYLARIAAEAPHVRHLPGPYTGRAMRGRAVRARSSDSKSKSTPTPSMCARAPIARRATNSIRAHANSSIGCIS